MERYVFPSHFYLMRKEEIFSTNSPFYGDGNSYVVVDTKNNYTYLINNSINELLGYFRVPHTLKELNEKYGTAVTGFFHSLIEVGLLRKNEWEPDLNTTAEKQLPVPPVSFKPYQIVRFLNRKSTVKVALVKKDGRKYILKYQSDLKDEIAGEIFTRELLALNKLGKNTHFAHLIEVDREKKFMVIKYVKGTSLKELIMSGSLSINEKVSIARQLILSLAYLHEKEIIHGDIHTSQFIIENRLHVVLIDFGFSHSGSGGFNEDFFIRGGVYKYVEPEHLSLNSFDRFLFYKPEYGCDIYRLGVVLYYLFYQVFPFRGLTWKDLYKIKQESYPEYGLVDGNAQKIPLIYIDIIKRCLDKNRESRFKDAVHMLEYLDSESSRSEK